MKIDLFNGDCLDVMRGMDAASVDSIVTDPPYGLKFMGKRWDHGVPSAEVWREALRVLKPGGHMLAFGGTRTYHRLVCAIEDAGFEIRDQIAWVYGSGFPKSLDVSKAIDKAAGAERERVAGPKSGGMAALCKGNAAHGYRGAAYYDDGNMLLSSEPATESARQWQGWGTALKPAFEPITVARKPLIGTVAENVLAHGTGGLNIDACRVGWPDGKAPEIGTPGWGGPAKKSTAVPGQDGETVERMPPSPLGRWPANLIHDGSDEVVALFPQSAGQQGAVLGTEPSNVGDANCYGKFGRVPFAARGDTGSAARFFYCAKASKADREDGLAHREAIHRPNGNKRTDQDYRVSSGERPPSAESGPRRNHHPTVKPTELMRYLCRLITPPGGTVLDPFMGSGSTGRGAIMEGFGFIGIEIDPDYLAIANDRISACLI